MADVVQLSEEQINALMAAKRGTSEYRDLLDTFLASDSRGIDITHSFGDKKAVNLANSFKRLVNKDSKYSGITVLNVNDTVALIKQ